MKIKHKFLVIFILLLLLTLGVTSYINFKSTEGAVIQSALKTMEHDLEAVSSDIAAFHEKAGSELIFALNYPVFYEYFSLPETRAGNKLDKDGVIQFSPDQKKLKTKIDEWAMFLQSRFPVAETCVIDRAGQEHSRITFREVAPTEDFSSEENEAPFFAPTFKLKKGDFHVQYPYMSHDATRWVFSYTSPIVLDDGTMPAIYHFEIPVSYLQEIIKSKSTSGRTFILDPLDLIVADSRQNIEIKLHHGHDLDTHEPDLREYLPPVSSVSGEQAFLDVIKGLKGREKGSVSLEIGGQTHFIVYRKLSTFDWHLVQIKSYSELLEGKTSLSNLRKTIVVSVLLSLIVAVGIIFVVSDKITRPLLNVTEAARRISDGDLNVELSDTSSKKDEMAHLVEAVRNMAEKLKETIVDVEEAAGKVTEAGQEMQSSSNKLASGASEQARKASQIAVSAEEMTRTIGEIADNTSSMAQTAIGAEKLARHGEEIVERSIKEMQAISEVVSSIASKVESLGKRSGEIGKIVGVINEIAEQTNMLALNAAIEAARAGEQGRGFAVVADEVRNLSERTAASTLQISGMIKAIQVEVGSAIASVDEGASKVEGGVEFSAKAGKALQDIVGSVRELGSMVDQIVTATSQLSNASEQISMDIGAIAEVSRGSSKDTEQVSRSASMLSELSETLQNTIRKFRM